MFSHYLYQGLSLSTRNAYKGIFNLNYRGRLFLRNVACVWFFLLNKINNVPIPKHILIIFCLFMVLYTDNIYIDILFTIVGFKSIYNGELLQFVCHSAVVKGKLFSIDRRYRYGTEKIPKPCYIGLRLVIESAPLRKGREKVVPSAALLRSNFPLKSLFLLLLLTLRQLLADIWRGRWQPPNSRFVTGNTEMHSS